MRIKVELNLAIPLLIKQQNGLMIKRNFTLFKKKHM